MDGMSPLPQECRSRFTSGSAATATAVTSTLLPAYQHPLRDIKIDRRIFGVHEHRLQATSTVDACQADYRASIEDKEHVRHWAPAGVRGQR
jgi:hypothetical protein